MSFDDDVFEDHTIGLELINAHEKREDVNLFLMELEQFTLLTHHECDPFAINYFPQKNVNVISSSLIYFSLFYIVTFTIFYRFSFFFFFFQFLILIK
jgi:hypothetical protein